MPHYQPFVLFGRSHEIVLALTVIVPLLLAPVARVSRPFARFVCRVFALAISGIWVVWYGVAYRNGWLDVGNALPMDLCSWAAVATVATLVRPNQKTYELAYFWALAGTLQGLLRPGIPYDFPEFRFIDFSIFHGGIIAAVLFLTWGMKMRPYPASIPRIVAWSLFYMAVAGAVDWGLGVNYGFLRSKPIYPSVYDLMPAWPYYLPVVVVLGALSALIYYAPFFLADQLRRWRK
ncbi:MAG: TIGR02206 family membrane protein [Alphaproteobacteria bacterium]|nr:TIGR02206 family membrane protein [Alphaproteobacteria bacterium]MDE2629547.1 TIGR02206 family membrane protein [Alphaproteobacteria bacterium]